MELPDHSECQDSLVEFKLEVRDRDEVEKT